MNSIWMEHPTIGAHQRWEEKSQFSNQGPFKWPDKQRYEMCLCVKLVWPSMCTKTHPKNIKCDQLGNQKDL